jgi:N-methylhydantoinase A
MYTINVDTGGTFTDVYLVSPHGITWAKSDTTPHDLTVGILEAIERAAEQYGLTRAQLLREIDLVRFSTTIGTNTLLTRTGPQVGMLAGAQLYDRVGSSLAPNLPLDEGLVEKVDEDADIAQLSAAVRSLLERGARLIVIALAAGPDLPQRERRMRDRVGNDYPRHYLGAVPVLSSHQITLHPDERVRIHSAVMDAYLHPVMARTLYRAEDQLREEGLRNPLLVANGDAGTSRVAKTTALRTWGSGPAGAMAGAAENARRLALEDVVIVDVGGTTSDIGFVRKGMWLQTPQPAIESVEVSVPIVDLTSIGLGGGSLARLVDGELRVGPQSAGALPGPACFGLGGMDPTVTDAALTMGLLDPHRFLGGRRVLQPELARRALDPLAEAMGRSVDETAWVVMERATQQLADAIANCVDAHGVDVADTVVFATGGGGGLFAHGAARLAGLKSAYVFPFTSTFSAFGLGCLDIVHSYEFALVPDESEQSLREKLDGLRSRAERDMAGEGLNTHAVSYWLELQHRGGVLGGDIVPLDGDATAAVTRVLSAAPDLELLRLKAAVGRHAVEYPPRADVATAPDVRHVRWDGGDPAPTPVHAWDSLAPDLPVSAPAILERDDCTVVLPPGGSARIGPLGEVVFVMAARQMENA